MQDEKETTEEKEKKKEREILLYILASSRSATLDSSYILYEGTFFFFFPWASTAARCAVFAYRYRIYAMAIYHTHTHTIQHTCTVEYCLRAVYSLLCFQGESIQQSLAFFPFFFFFFSTLLPIHIIDWSFVQWHRFQSLSPIFLSRIEAR